MAYTHRLLPLTLEEAQRLAHHAGAGPVLDRLMVYVLLDCGLRVSELAGLDVAALDSQYRRIRIRGKRARGKKGTPGPVRYRFVPLTSRAQSALEQYLTVHPRIGHGPRWIERRIRELAGGAGIMTRCTPHVLRHTFAHEAIRRGVSIPALQAILGHGHLSSTAVYTHLSDEEVTAEYRRKFGA